MFIIIFFKKNIKRIVARAKVTIAFFYSFAHCHDEGD